MLRWVVVGAACFLPSVASAEPHAFGIRPGTKIKDAPIKIDGDPSWLIIRLGDVPKPHPWLRAYTANVNSNMEICAVTGSGDITLSDTNAKPIALIKQLSEVYGSPSYSSENPNMQYFESADAKVSLFISSDQKTAQLKITFKPAEGCRDMRVKGNPFK